MTRQKRLGHLLAETMSYGTLFVMNMDNVNYTVPRHYRRKVRNAARDARTEYQQRRRRIGV